MTVDGATLIEWAWKSFVVSGAALGLLRLLRQRSAAERSGIAHLALVALLLLPAGALLLPGWTPLPASAPTVLQPMLGMERFAMPTGDMWVPRSEAGQVAPAGAGVPASVLAVALYAVPLLLLVATTLVAIARLFAMRRRAAVLVAPAWLAALAQAQQRMGFKHGTALLVSDELRSPISWGVVRPTIVLDRRVLAATGDAEAIIAHELAHVARLDWAKLLIARIACALFWFNPLVWILARESHQLREETADDAVLLSDVDGADYATLLVNAARHDNKALLLAAHGVAPARGSLKRRITRVLDHDLRRGPARGAFTALAVLSVLALVGPLAAFDPAAAAAEAPPAAVATTAPPASAAAPTLAAGQAAPAAPARPAAPAPLSAEALTRMRAVGVSPAYVRSLRNAGLPPSSTDDLVRARAVGLDPAYAAAMRDAYPDADIDALVKARAVGVDAAYAQAFRAAAPDTPLRDIVEARAVGLSSAYVAEMRALFPAVRLSQLTAMRAVGVTADYVRAMRRQGIRLDEPGAAVRARALAPGSRRRASASAKAVAATEAEADADEDPDPDE